MSPIFHVADRNATKLITVEMLLNHNCGVDGERFPDAGPDGEPIDDVIPRIARQGQIHAPGAELVVVQLRCGAGRLSG